MEKPRRSVLPTISVLKRLNVWIQEFGPSLKRHHLTSLPPYLILHIKRFTKNNFVEERNPTIVNFPLRGVEMSDCQYSLSNFRQACTNHMTNQMSTLSPLILCTLNMISFPTYSLIPQLHPPLLQAPVPEYPNATLLQEKRIKCPGKSMSGRVMRA